MVAQGLGRRRFGPSTLLEIVERLPELVAHLIEGPRQGADLVLGFDLGTGRQPTRADLGGDRGQTLDRPDDVGPEHVGEQQGERQRDQAGGEEPPLGLGELSAAFVQVALQQALLFGGDLAEQLQHALRGWDRLGAEQEEIHAPTLALDPDEDLVGQRQEAPADVVDQVQLLFLRRAQLVLLGEQPVQRPAVDRQVAGVLELEVLARRGDIAAQAGDHGEERGLEARHVAQQVGVLGARLAPALGLDHLFDGDDDLGDRSVALLDQELQAGLAGELIVVQQEQAPRLARPLREGLFEGGEPRPEIFRYRDTQFRNAVLSAECLQGRQVRLEGLAGLVVAGLVALVAEGQITADVSQHF
jgi:hypothetical protein